METFHLVVITDKRHFHRARDKVGYCNVERVGSD